MGGSWGLNGEVDPLAGLRAFDDGLEKGDAAEAVMGGGEVGGGGGRGESGVAGPPCGGVVAVEVGEGFDKTFGMAGGKAEGLAGGFVKAGAASTEDFAGAVRVEKGEGVGFLLGPVEAAAHSVDAEAKGVFLAGEDLACGEDAAGSAVEVEEDGAVVVEAATGNEGGEVGAEGLDGEAGDEFGEVFGVGSDVAHAAAESGLGGIGAPCGLFLALLFEGGGQPALGVFDEDTAKGAEGTGPDAGASLADHGVAGVVVGEHEEAAGFFDEADEGLSVGEGGGEGFVANHIKACFEGEPGGGVMEVIGGDDGDEVHALFGGKLGFAGDHGVHVGVAAMGRDEPVVAGVAGTLGVGAEGSANEFDGTVEGGGHAVDGTDEGALTSADHAHTKFPVGFHSEDTNGVSHKRQDLFPSFFLVLGRLHPSVIVARV